jgi:Family of unknown function (DUF6776)
VAGIVKLRSLQFALLVVVVLLVAGGWELYDIGKLHGVIELAQVRADNNTLGRKIRKLMKENNEMVEKLAILERSSQIDQQAAQAVKSDLAQLEDELQAAREEVEFYRGIVAPGDVNPGLRIHRFALEAGLAGGEFHYDLVLTQLKHNDQFISGVVDWKVVGTRNGEPAELELSGVTDPEIRQLKFRFRYFQDLTGEIRVPEGFEPDHVELTVIPEGKGGQSPVVQKFNWP